MVADLLSKHWNDILTVLAFSLSLLVAYYQIRHYRAEVSEVNILDTIEPDYSGYMLDSMGDAVRSNSGDLSNTYYTMKLLIENDGRESTTISNAHLNLTDTGEVLELKNKHTVRQHMTEAIKLGENERKRVFFTATGDVREDYSKNIEGLVRLDTTSGVVEHNVTLRPYTEY
jgi:hypothetical protein